MFHNLAEDIAFLLIKKKLIDIDQRDVYIYGLEIILLNGGLVLLFLLISLLCKSISNFWAYLLFFIPLRMLSGGYHSKTSERCFILSIIMYMVSIIVVKLVPTLYLSKWSIFGGLIGIIVILILSPLVNENNPLNEKQVKRNKIIVCILLLIDLVAFILFYKFSCSIASNLLIFIFLDAILLAIGKLTTINYQKNQ